MQVVFGSQIQSGEFLQKSEAGRLDPIQIGCLECGDVCNGSLAAPGQPPPAFLGQVPPVGLQLGDQHAIVVGPPDDVLQVLAWLIAWPNRWS